MKYYHATSFDSAQKILFDKTIKKGFDGVVYLCDSIENASKFLMIRGMNDFVVFELDGLDKQKIEESFDHNEAFFGCKAWCYLDDIDIRNHWTQLHAVQGQTSAFVLDEKSAEIMKSFMRLQVAPMNGRDL